MKKIKNIMLVIILFLVTYLFNNVRTLAAAFLGGEINLKIMNITLFISLLLIILIVMFRTKLFKNKIPFYTFIMVILLLNLAQGFFRDFNVYPFLIMYLYILFITYFAILITKKRFELSIVISFSLLLLFAFVTGMFGILSIFKYVMLISVFVISYLIFKIGKKDKGQLIEARDELFGTTFTIFNFLFVICVFGGAGMYVNSWDEYSHWAYDAKATIHYSKFGASQEVMSKTKGYAPIFTMWHYIISIFGNFSEQNLYIGLSLFTTIFMMPAFYWIRKNNVITKVLAVLSIAFCCYLFSNVYQYSSLYADLPIAVIFGSILIIYNISRSEKKSMVLPLGLLLTIITLTKTNGFVIAFTALLIFFVSEILNNKAFKLKNIVDYVIKFIKENFKYILIIIITFLTWKIYLFIMDKITTDYYNFTLLPESLRSDLSLKLNSEFIANFIKKIIESFDDVLVFGTFKFSLYHFIIIMFSLIFGIFYFENKKNIEQAVKKTVPYLIGYVAFFILTVVSMFLMMTKYEASNLASFGRYINWFHLGVIIFCLSYIAKFGNDKKISLNIIPYLFVILMLPFSNTFYYVTNYSNRANSYSIYVERTEKVKNLVQNTEDETLVYVIDQQDKDGIMAMWYTRYYAFPRKTNASSGAITWKIRTDKNADDLQDWGLTAKEWEKHLIDYDFKYVFLYTADDAFFEETKFMYDDYERAKNYELFKVVKHDGEVKLVPIK